MVPGMGPTAAQAATEKKISAWLPYWDQARAYQSFVDNAHLYDEVSPFWYEMTSATSILRYPNAEDLDVISGIKSRGVRLIPTINNDFDAGRVSTMLSSSVTRTAHVTALVNLVTLNGYDGIDVDYESLAATDRDRYTAFISELSVALHALGKTLTVAVHPKTSEPGNWSGPQAQDYAALGRAVDKLRVMAYDYHWATSGAGPVAPLSWVDDVARFAASQVAPEKVQLGMPLYGYDWVDSTGEGVTYEIAASRMQTHGATRQWSQTDAAPWFSYTAGGKTHTVWYEDAQSIAAKLPIVDRHGLGGAVFWRLGGEDPNVWAQVGGDVLWTQNAGESSDEAVVAPSVPTSLVAKARADAVALRWQAATDANGGAAGYEIYLSTSENGDYTKVASTADTTFVVPALASRTTYRFHVKAYDGAGNVSAASNVASATTRR
ncbi:MAG: fibronectin type III domain-containing protein [Actinobacteria bacterium]|nr:fibronectin type III domain-containing protein [Actinomycetota bacterium]